MDYIKQFTDIEEYNQYRNSLEFVEPSLGMIGEHGIVKFYPTNDMDQEYSDVWVEIARFTTTGTTTYTITKKYTQLGFWIVGGGAGGHGDFNTAHWGGNGGNGGQAKAFETIYNSKSITVYVGDGGSGGSAKGAGNSGGGSYVMYNGNTYTSDGGIRYSGSNGGVNTKVEYSGIGGRPCGHGNPQTLYYKASENEPYGVMGEDGLPNPFDQNDETLYGAGGSAGFDSYDNWTTYGGTYPTGFAGGQTGGGNGGYGPNDNILNTGFNGTSPGAGGGGGAFSSNHTHSQGGNGYQGIVIIYGK